MVHIRSGAIGAIVITAALVFGAGQAGAGERADGSDEVLAALERDLGLTPEQAEEQGALQERAVELDVRLQEELGAAYAGAWYDAERGQLVVNVTDEVALEVASAAGAEARLARYSWRELSAITARLDAEAGGPGDGDERRRGVEPRDIGLSGWAIDPVTNSVRVSVTAEQADAAKQLVAELGDAVTVEELVATPDTTAFMDGGDGINGDSCSAGFNLRNASTGARYLLTAGHCVTAGSTLRGQGGVTFGRVLESWFPSFDDAIARNDNTRHWVQGPWVDTAPSNGNIVTTSGSTDGLVGTTVCKSGITTGWTCGRITGKDETVTFRGGRTVFGLTRHNACVEPGDSGGANVSVFGSTRRAEGVTSGAQLIEWDGRERCIAAIWGWLGFQNTSWYFPIADSLAYYGPRYGVTTW